MMAGAGGAMRATGWRATAIRFQQFGEGVPAFLTIARARGADGGCAWRRRRATGSIAAGTWRRRPSVGWLDVELSLPIFRLALAVFIPWRGADGFDRRAGWHPR